MQHFLREDDVVATVILLTAKPIHDAKKTLLQPDRMRENAVFVRVVVHDK